MWYLAVVRHGGIERLFETMSAAASDEEPTRTCG